jgi:hypothetical protein
VCAVSSSTSPNVNARPLLENGRATHDAFIQAWQDGTGLIPPRLFFFLYPASLSAFHFLVDLIYHFVTHVVPPPPSLLLARLVLYTRQERVENPDPLIPRVEYTALHVSFFFFFFCAQRETGWVYSSTSAIRSCGKQLSRLARPFFLALASRCWPWPCC